LSKAIAREHWSALVSFSRFPLKPLNNRGVKAFICPSYPALGYNIYRILSTLDSFLTVGGAGWAYVHRWIVFVVARIVVQTAQIYSLALPLIGFAYVGFEEFLR
jgi:hypothetical protein